MSKFDDMQDNSFDISDQNEPVIMSIKEAGELEIMEPKDHRVMLLIVFNTPPSASCLCGWESGPHDSIEQVAALGILHVGNR